MGKSRTIFCEIEDSHLILIRFSPSPGNGDKWNFNSDTGTIGSIVGIDCYYRQIGWGMQSGTITTEIHLSRLTAIWGQKR
ncbi:hypothetical protein [Acetobacterium sp.]|uniref:hypothetical protein n=1 Tax=Acetobacterium sp. TaxID=1872094 RepID=UPI00272187BF|nr:hypothetical protein [Acetobacterium sp.]MDO9492911.1 hypothetical protein [Acetobacterium sp.]